MILARDRISLKLNLHKVGNDWNVTLGKITEFKIFVVAPFANDHGKWVGDISVKVWLSKSMHTGNVRKCLFIDRATWR